jgi:exopolysaccharide biosynthesis polyprenyl glycosylphosphotransferase
MNRRRFITLALLFLDIIATVIVFTFVAFLRGLPIHDELTFAALIVPILAIIFGLTLIDGYNARTDMISVNYASQHMIALLAVMIGVLLLTYGIITSPFALQSSRSVIVISFVLLLPLTVAYRRLFYLRNLRFRGEQWVVFVGDAVSRDLFKIECQQCRFNQPVIFCSSSTETHPPVAGVDVPALATLQSVLQEIETSHRSVEAIVLRETPKELTPAVTQKLVKLYFSGIPTYTLELFHEVYWRKVPIYRLNQIWLFQDGFRIAREPVFERIKRTIDIVLATLGMLLTAPVLALASLAIWVESRGPIFFTQTRIGKNQVPFRICKLRTMRPSASTALYTQPNDERVTRVGKILRATRVDEFPQMWNVFIGDMSLIGPRAEWDRLVEGYEKKIPCYHFRHFVKPGITGWAQVNYPYGSSSADTIRKLEYDLFYIRHLSFKLDATIILKTIHVMLFAKGR